MWAGCLVFHNHISTVPPTSIPRPSTRAPSLRQRHTFELQISPFLPRYLCGNDADSDEFSEQQKKIRESCARPGQFRSFNFQILRNKRSPASKPCFFARRHFFGFVFARTRQLRDTRTPSDSRPLSNRLRSYQQVRFGADDADDSRQPKTWKYLHARSDARGKTNEERINCAVVDSLCGEEARYAEIQMKKRDQWKSLRHGNRENLTKFCSACMSRDPRCRRSSLGANFTIACNCFSNLLTASSMKTGRNATR
jgi:hypothetical protein